MKKIIFRILFLIIIIIVAYFIYIQLTYSKPTPKDVPGDYYEKIEALTKFDTNIIIYGDPIQYPKDIKYTKIDKLSDMTLLSEAEHNFLIINMSKDTEFELTKNELDLIVEYRVNHGFHILFVGLTKYDYLREYGLLDDYDFEGSSVVYLKGGDPAIHKMLPSVHGHEVLTKNTRVYFTVRVMLELIEDNLVKSK